MQRHPRRRQFALRQSEAKVLKVVPDSALGVLVVNRLRDTSARLEKLGRNLQIGIPNPLGFAKAIAGVNHGVDEQCSLAIALFSKSKDERPVGPVHSSERLCGIPRRLARQRSRGRNCG